MTINKAGENVMDLLIGVDELESGMVLSRPIKRESQLLYPEGKKVSARDIDRLQKWGVDEVYVKSRELVTVS